MSFTSIEGRPVRFPPGKVEIRLDENHRSMYRDLYSRYGTWLKGLPVLKDADFDGRRVRVTPAQLEALNRAFAGLSQGPTNHAGSVYGAQEASRTRLFKRLQHLS